MQEIRKLCKWYMLSTEFFVKNHQHRCLKPIASTGKPHETGCAGVVRNNDCPFIEIRQLNFREVEFGLSIIRDVADQDIGDTETTLKWIQQFTADDWEKATAIDIECRHPQIPGFVGRVRLDVCSYEEFKEIVERIKSEALADLNKKVKNGWAQREKVIHLPGGGIVRGRVRA